MFNNLSPFYRRCSGSVSQQNQLQKLQKLEHQPWQRRQRAAEAMAMAVAAAAVEVAEAAAQLLICTRAPLHDRSWFRPPLIPSGVHSWAVGRPARAATIKAAGISSGTSHTPPATRRPPAAAAAAAAAQ